MSQTTIHPPHFFSLTDNIRDKAARNPQTEALHFLPDGKPEHAQIWTYADLDKRARTIARAIQEKNGEGHPVLLMLPPGLEFIGSFFGCLYAKAIAVPMTPPGLARMARTFQRLARIVDDSGAEIIITTTKLKAAIDEITERIHVNTKLSLVLEDELDPGLATKWVAPQFDPEDPGWLQYTSGSTSDPKGVIVTHGNIMANLKSIVLGMRLVPGIPTVSWLPPFHDMGLVGGILTPLSLGALCVTMPPMAFLRNPACWFTAVAHYKAQLTGGPNFAYDMVSNRMRDEQIASLNLSHLAVCYCGSEPIRAQTVERFLARFAKANLKESAFYPCYGLAENTLYTTGTWNVDDKTSVFLDKNAYANKQIQIVQKDDPAAWTLISSGLPTQDNDVRIVDPKTLRECQDDTIGEIWVKGACVAQGYWKNAEATKISLKATLADTEEGPFLRTGDLGFFHKGHLFVSGRRKEMIIIHGRNFFPQDIEESVVSHIPDLEPNGAAAFGIETDQGEGLVVVFECKTTQADFETILATIRSLLTECFDVVPAAIVLCKRHGVPKTTSGKIQQSLCREHYLSGELPVLAKWEKTALAEDSTVWENAPSAGSAPKVWETWLLSGLARRLGLSVEDLSPHTAVSSLGLTSQNAVRLSTELGTALGRHLPATLFYECRDIAELADCLSGALPHDHEKKTERLLLKGSEEPTEELAIVGMALRLPGAETPEEFADLLFDGRSQITDPPANRVNTRKGGYLKDIAAFDPNLFGISAREAEEMDPQQRLLLLVSYEALERAAIAPDSLTGSATGVFIGISTNDYEESRLAGDLPLSAYVGTGNAHAIAANRLSYVYGTHGPSMAIDSACSSSLLALHLACQSLRAGECDRAIVGGVNVLGTDTGTEIFDLANLMAKDGLCKTFSADADGYVRSEGCVVVIVESVRRARAERHPILAIVRGTAVNQDGHTSGLTAPSRSAQAKLIKQALKNAKLLPQDIDVLEAHGTGTLLGDPIEWRAINDVYAQSHTEKNPLIISSVKTAIGHTESCAGLAGVCKCLLAMKAGAIPPHLHLSRVNPEIDQTKIPAEIPTTTRPWPNTSHPKRAGISSFGFGGTNVHVILEEAKTTKTCASQETNAFFLPIQAQSEAQVRRLAKAYAAHIAKTHDFARACETAGRGRSHFPFRVAVSSPEELHSLPAIVHNSKAQENRGYVLIVNESQTIDHPLFRELVESIPENTLALPLVQGYAHIRWLLRLLGQPRAIVTNESLFRAALLATPKCTIHDALAAEITEEQLANACPPILRTGTDIASRFPNDLLFVVGQKTDVPENERTVYAQKPEDYARAFATLWEHGLNLPFTSLFEVDETLPTYPFDQKHYWFTGESEILKKEKEESAQTETSVTMSQEETQELVTTLVRSLLKLPETEKLDPQTNLISLGFDSLLLLELANALSSKLGVRVQARTVLTETTIAAISAGLSTARPTPESKPFTHNQAERYEPFPLTDVQHAYWLGRNAQLVLGGVSCSNYLEVDVEDIDLERLEDALNSVIARHDMLRARFTQDGEQVVLPSIPRYHIEREVCPSDPKEEQAYLEKKRAALSHAVLPADTPPLLDIRASLRAHSVRLHIKIDLLVCDALSFGILLRDLTDFYEHPESKKSILPITFRDYVLAKEKARKEDQDYWQEKLAHLPEGIELPLAKSPESIGTPHFDRLSARLPMKDWEKIKELARTIGVTPSILLLACFAMTLARFAAKPSFCLMLTTFDRPPVHEAMRDIVGDFTQLLLLGVSVPKNASLAEQAKALGQTLASDMRHASVSGIDVLRMANPSAIEASSRSAVVFTSALPVTREDVFAPITGYKATLAHAISQTPQVWLDHQIYEIHGDLVFTWDVVTALFPPHLVETMFTYYADFLRKLSSERALITKPLPLAALPKDQARVRQAVNATGVDIPAKALWQAFAEYPGDPNRAVCFTDEKTLTAQELFSEAKALAETLVKHSVRPGDIVGILMEKNVLQVVAAYGIQMAGASYLPIDMALPEQRIRYMLTHARVTVCVVQEKTRAQAEALGCIALHPGSAPQEEMLLPKADPASTAYVIYTSGSTGTPKGVVLTHKAANNTLVDIRKRFALGPKDRVLGLASLSFDLSVFDVFGVLGSGGAIVLPNPEDIQNPEELCRKMRTYGVTVWNSTPSLLQMLLDYLEEHEKDCPQSLRLVLLSGDWVPLNLPQRLRAFWPNATIAALGGATEASIWSNVQVIETVDPEWKSIPYGKPLSNQGYCVLDQDLCPCPDYVPGNLYITGAGLAEGYLNDPEKTRASFFRHPVTQEKLYATGDLGRYWSDGTLEFLGRRDSQVKINGYRIELEEIETAMRRCATVQNAAVLAIKEEGGDRLVGFVTRKDQNMEESEAEYEARKKAMQAAGITLIDANERLTFKQEEHNLRKGLAKACSVSLPEESRTVHDYSARISSRRFLQKAVPMQTFSAWIAGLASLQTPAWPTVKYRYASAGWTYAVQTYVLIKEKRIEGLEAGLYYYQPKEHVLYKTGELPKDVDQLFPGQNAEIFESCAYALFFVAETAAITPLYGTRANDFLLIEAGAMCHSLEERAMTVHLGCCQIGQMAFEKLWDGFGLGASHRYLHCLLGGPVERKPSWDFTQALAESIPDSVGSAAQDENLAHELAQWLPSYMVPTVLKTVPRIPLTANGKVDRDKLRTLLHEGPKTVRVAPESPMEERLVAIIQEILGKESVGVTDTFFDLGANSLKLVLFQRRINEESPKRITIPDIFRHPTIRSLAAFLTQDEAESAKETADVLRQARERAQRRRKRAHHEQTANSR
ncbi:MAG: amino acid adenylation domain-containing protein [Desulfovibrionaceae bacterium]|nr:amino acid adenylation domain-containing protein [Desulfovibrionaceae bacterium]